MDVNVDPDVLALVGDVGRRMQANLPLLTDGMGALLADGVAGINNDPDLTDMLYASIGGNLSTIFLVLANDIPIEHLQPPTAAVEYALRCAQRGVPGNALRRAYHVGQDDLMAGIFAEIQDLDCLPDQKVLVLHRTSRVVNAYIDWITQFVLQVYDDEKHRWLDASSNMTSSLIHKLIDRKAVDAETFKVETGYALDQFHVGMIAWTVAQEPGQNEIVHLQKCLLELSAKCGATGEPIITAIDRSTVWAWMPLNSHPEAFDLDAVRAFAQGGANCRLTLGLPAFGSTGFARSHDQAKAARVLAAAMDGEAAPALSYGDQGVAICSVLARGMDATRTWVHEVLGSLAIDSEAHARLRDTLRVFLGTGGSYTESAEILNLHRNSVKYRIVKAAEERGRPFTNDRLDVELALQVCHFLGSAVMTRRLVGSGS